MSWWDTAQNWLGTTAVNTVLRKLQHVLRRGEDVLTEFSLLKFHSCSLEPSKDFSLQSSRVDDRSCFRCCLVVLVFSYIDYEHTFYSADRKLQ